MRKLMLVLSVVLLASCTAVKIPPNERLHLYYVNAERDTTILNWDQGRVYEVEGTKDVIIVFQENEVVLITDDDE